MKKTVSLLLALMSALCLALGSAAGEGAGLTGRLFLGDGFTGAAAPAEIPPEAGTAVFPVSAERAITVENGNARRMLCFVKDNPNPLEVCVVPDETAHLRIEVRADDDPAGMILRNALGSTENVRTVSDLYDTEAGAFVFDCPMRVPTDGNALVGLQLMSREQGTADPNACELLLIPDEECLDEAAAMLEARGYEGIRWESAETARQDDTQTAYVLHVVDQYGAPVPEVYMNFCTDTTCSLAMGDESGIVTFGGDPGVYHVQLIRVPDGYSADPAFELYTRPAYGEWVLRVKKD